MRAEYFHRDKYYAARIRSGETDPFDLRVFDYRIHRALPRWEAEQLTQAVFIAFDSLRAAIERDDSGVGKAYYIAGREADCEYIETDSVRIISATREKARRSNLASINLFGGELAKFCYFVSRAENATVLRIVCSHFAIDQVTQGLLGRFVAGYVAGERAFEKKEPGYLDWMSAYYHYARSDAGLKEISFWKNYFVGDFEDARRDMASSTPDAGVRATYTLPSVAVTELRELCRARLRCRLTDVLATQTLCAIGKEYGLERIPVSWTAHGRYPMGGRSFVRTAGWLGERHPLLVPIGGGSIEELTGDFRHAISTLPVWGNAFGWINRFAGGDGGGLEDQLNSPFILNVQESAGSARSLFDGGSLLFEPFSKLGVAPRIYVVISVGSSVKITLECAGGANPEACKRIALRLEEIYEAVCQTSGA